MSWRWWEQEGIDIEGTKERSAAELDGVEENCREEVSQEETLKLRSRQGILR